MHIANANNVLGNVTIRYTNYSQIHSFIRSLGRFMGVAKQNVPQSMSTAACLRNYSFT